mgnify:CR=1 FL=1
MFMFRQRLFTLVFIALIAYPDCGNAEKTSKKHHLNQASNQSTQSSSTKAPSKLPELGARPYGQRPEVMAQAADIAERRSLPPDWTADMLGQARHLPSVARLMLPAPRGQKKDWGVYRGRFIDPIRIGAGLKFWRTNAALLARAEQVYGVSPEIVVGIIGVETIYGRQTGSFRVMDALATLAFDFPAGHPRAAARQAFFRDELEQFLSLMHRSGGEPFSVRGSYAGAIGMPQFMPSSIAKHAVDFDDDGKIDLTNSVADVIGSVANYFKAYGWTSGVPTHFEVQFDASTLDLDALLAPDILPTFSALSIEKLGARLTEAGKAYPGKLALIELQMGAQPAQYVVGTDNFYTITRYNWSSYYAMAVIELGQAVAKEVRRE